MTHTSDVTFEFSPVQTLFLIALFIFIGVMFSMIFNKSPKPKTEYSIAHLGQTGDVEIHQITDSRGICYIIESNIQPSSPSISCH